MFAHQGGAIAGAYKTREQALTPFVRAHFERCCRQIGYKCRLFLSRRLIRVRRRHWHGTGSQRPPLACSQLEPLWDVWFVNQPCQNCAVEAV